MGKKIIDGRESRREFILFDLHDLFLPFYDIKFSYTNLFDSLLHSSLFWQSTTHR